MVQAFDGLQPSVSTWSRPWVVSIVKEGLDHGGNCQEDGDEDDEDEEGGEEVS